MRLSLALSLLSLVLLVLPGHVASEIVEGLYRSEAIVTGQDNLPERQRGFREALTDVLIKVSGDARLADDRRLPSVLERASAAVTDFSYEDRLAKKKLMDEQGTRERSYWLRVSFDPRSVDRLLGDFGARPWSADRPRLLVALGIRDTVGPYVPESASPRGYGQREVLASVARRRGIPVVLPSGGEPTEALHRPALSFEAVATEDQEFLQRLKKETAADAVLAGTMEITPSGLWNTRWSLWREGAAPEDWRIDGTTFDRAIADGVNGSARRLAGID